MSIIGKITVIKTFALPKLIYPLTVLENPSEELINIIKKNMFDFLWDNKPDKINRKTIIQNYEIGGLKTIDINIFINSIKSGWVKRINDNKNNGDWKAIYLKQIDKFGGKLIFECNLNLKDLIKSFKIDSGFLSDILQSWCTLNFNENIDNIKKEIIWNNTHIKNNNKTILYKSWLDKGIKYIMHLFDSRSKVFYTFQHIKNVYALDNGDFLKYYTLIQSITHQWVVQLKSEIHEINKHQITLLDQLAKQKSANKYLYNKQLGNIANNLIIKPHIKWEQEFNHDINWKCIHTLPIVSLINTKLRAFQYKYLMRIVPNNNFLYRCNLSNTSLCDFCSMNIETNKHMFWECYVSRGFWTEIERLLKDNQIRIKLDYEIISFGYLNQSSYTSLLNCILIYAKYFIFKTKYEQTVPSLNNFIKYLKYHENLERIIATAKDKIQKHEAKWNQLHIFRHI